MCVRSTCGLHVGCVMSSRLYKLCCVCACDHSSGEGGCVCK